jgi:NCAIR mutase (PurE)-related protein
MEQNKVRRLLGLVAEGSVSVDDAVLQLRKAPFEDLGFAKVDHHRGLRTGAAEVIYGAGKTPQQIRDIAAALAAEGQKTVLVTRLSPDAARFVQNSLPMQYYEIGRVGIIGEMPVPDGRGTIAVITGGTCDMPVAEEAALTANALGNEVTRIYDVGVAGLHRLLAHTDEIMSARVIIAIAGMEGALPSVIGGIVDVPVIAVPTSIGYGAAFEGLAALLSMLNSCASGVSVVNIDNGFGAGYLASMINHIGAE